MNKHKRNLSMSFIAVVILLGIHTTAFGNEGGKHLPPEVKHYQDFCNYEIGVPRLRFFDNTYSKATQIRQTLCDASPSNKESLTDRVLSLLNDLDSLFPSTKIHEFLKNNESVRLNNGGDIAILQVRRMDGFINLILENDHTAIPVSDNALLECDSIAKTIDPDCDCDCALNDFKSIYNDAQATVGKQEIDAYSNSLAFIHQDWNRFLDRSKRQSLLELFVNGARFNKEKKNNHQFSSPPSSQLILLRQYVILEYQHSPTQGKEFKEAFILELAGVSYWKQEKFFFPSGASIVTVFSDRAGISYLSFGAALHFQSMLTIGGTDSFLLFNRNFSTGSAFLASCFRLLSKM